MPPTNADQPDFFTVEEAARILRIGRTAAYELARTWRTTNGKEGLPVVAFGRLLRVPRRAMEELTGGSVALPVVDRVAPAHVPEPVAPPLPPQTSEVAQPTRRRHARKRSASPDQTSFPFT